MTMVLAIRLSLWFAVVIRIIERGENAADLDIHSVDQTMVLFDVVLDLLLGAEAGVPSAGSFDRDWKIGEVAIELSLGVGLGVRHGIAGVERVVGGIQYGTGRSSRPARAGPSS